MRIRQLSRDKEYWRKRCVDLEEQIEADDVDFMRVLHAREAEKLRKLCRDMYAAIDSARGVYLEKDKYADRMEELGLLEEK